MSTFLPLIFSLWTPPWKKPWFKIAISNIYFETRTLLCQVIQVKSLSLDSIALGSLLFTLILNYIAQNSKKICFA